MSAVGGIICWSVKGGVGEPARSVATWRLLGVAGMGAMDLGLNDSGFAFTLVQFGSRVDITAWCASIRALKGQVVTIVTDRGVTYAGTMFIETVSWPPLITVAVGAGGVEERAELRITGRMTA